MIDDVIRQALDRIARTADGAVLYRYLHRELCSLCPDASDGALRRHEGKRTLASDLMALMAEGIDASGRRDDTGILGRRSGGSDEQPKRKLSIREYLAEQPSWTGQPVAGTNPDDKPAGTVAP